MEDEWKRMDSFDQFKVISRASQYLPFYYWDRMNIFNKYLLLFVLCEWVCVLYRTNSKSKYVEVYEGKLALIEYDWEWNVNVSVELMLLPRREWLKERDWTLLPFDIYRFVQLKWSVYISFWLECCPQVLNFTHFEHIWTQIDFNNKLY